MTKTLAFRSQAGKVVTVALTVTALTACNALQRMADVGAAPKLSQTENPVLKPGYRPITMPMPAPRASQPQANSLWRPGARAFFKDQRASEVGDILTVVVNISKEKAELSNTTTRKRTNPGETASATNLLGYEAALKKVLPDNVDPTALIDFTSNSTYTGDGSIAREETINFKLATVVTQVLPNGNLAIAGQQEIRVNNELREVMVTGVIRPEDILSTNTIDWDKIAEARITYGGRGTLSDVQQPRYGQQIFDIIFPF